MCALHICLSHRPPGSDLDITAQHSCLLVSQPGPVVHSWSSYMYQTNCNPSTACSAAEPVGDCANAIVKVISPSELSALVLFPAGLMQLLATAHTTSLTATSRASWSSTCSPRRCAHHDAILYLTLQSTTQSFDWQGRPTCTGCPLKQSCKISTTVMPLTL